MTSCKRIVAIAVALISTGSLCGCGSRPSVVNGKVIHGDISFIVTVDATDPRLKGEGIVGATVEAYTASERGAAMLAHSVSDAKGNFALSIREGDVLTHPAEFSADKEGFSRTSMVMPIPPVDKRVLVILKQGGASPPR